MKYLNKINVPLALLSVLALKVTIFGTGIGDALAVMALSGLYGFVYWNESKKIVLDETTKKQIDEVKSALTVMKMNQTIKTSQANEKDVKKRYF